MPKSKECLILTKEFFERKDKKKMARAGFEPTHFSSVYQETAKVPPKDALHLVRGDALPLGHLTD